MFQKTVLPEWQILSDGADWDALETAAGLVAIGERTGNSHQLQARTELLLSTCLILVTAAMYTLWAQTKSDINLRPIKDQAAIELDATAQGAASQITELHQTLSSKHFQFQFHPHDGQLVETVNPRIDDFYRSLRQDFGVPQLHTPIMVEIKMKSMVGSQLHFDNDQWTVIVPAPSSLAMPENLTQADTLFLFLASALTDQALEEVQQQTRVRAAWRQMPEVMRRWYVVRHHDGLSAWHDGMVSWLVTLDKPSITSAIPEDLRQTCRAFHEATVTISWHGAIPLHSCPAVLTPENSLLIPALPTTLEALSSPKNEWAESPYHIETWVQLKATETLIDYVANRYGPAQIGSLFRGFTQYDSWDELIPVVFNIPAAEFEAGWQSYMNETHDWVMKGSASF